MQRREQLAASGARLLELAALHRTGDVEHERNVPRRGLNMRGGWRRDGDQCETVLVAGGIRQHRDRGAGRSPNRDEQRHVARVAAHDRSRFAGGRRDIKFVRRRVDRAQVVRRCVRECEARRAALARLAAHPLHAARAGGRAAEIVDAQGVAFPLGDALEAHDHALLFAGVDREDARAQQTVTHPLDERGVPLFANDFFVDATRLAGIHRLAAHELSVYRQLEVLEGGAGRQREEIIGFTDYASFVDEPFLDVVVEHAIH